MAPLAPLPNAPPAAVPAAVPAAEAPDAVPDAVAKHRPLRPGTQGCKGGFDPIGASKGGKGKGVAPP